MCIRLCTLPLARLYNPRPRASLITLCLRFVTIRLLEALSPCVQDTTKLELNLNVSVTSLRSRLNIWNVIFIISFIGILFTLISPNKILNIHDDREVLLGIWDLLYDGYLLLPSCLLASLVLFTIPVAAGDMGLQVLNAVGLALVGDYLIGLTLLPFWIARERHAWNTVAATTGMGQRSFHISENCSYMADDFSTDSRSDTV